MRETDRYTSIIFIIIIFIIILFKASFKKIGGIGSFGFCDGERDSRRKGFGAQTKARRVRGKDERTVHKRSTIQQRNRFLLRSIIWEKKSIFLMYHSGDARVQLSKHLLRTLCTDMANICLAALAEEHLMSSMEPQSFSVEVSKRVIITFPSF